MRAAAGFLVVWLFAGILPANAAEIAFPALSGRVVDQANILSAETERTLTTTLEQFETATTNQMVVVTLASLQGQAIEDFGYQLGRAWGIGRAGKNNGILLIVAPTERTVRIEVGYGLEGEITDALSRGIIEQEILPRFRNNDYDGGVRAGVNAITAVLQGDARIASRLTEAGSRKVSPVDVTIFWLVVAFVLVFFGIGVWQEMRGGGGGVGPWGRTRRRGSYWGFPVGGSRGGGFGGGGFSGGGGSFGGGGASGRW